MTNPYYLQDGGVLVLDKDGNIIKVAPDDARCIVPDGERVHVSMFMIDGKSKCDGRMPIFDASCHQPRQGVRSDADRIRLDALHQNYVKRLNDAWRNPGPAPLSAATKPPSESALAPTQRAPNSMADSKAAYERGIKRLEGAWRTAK